MDTTTPALLIAARTSQRFPDGSGLITPSYAPAVLNGNSEFEFLFEGVLQSLSMRCWCWNTGSFRARNESVDGDLELLESYNRISTHLDYFALIETADQFLIRTAPMANGRELLLLGSEDRFEIEPDHTRQQNLVRIYRQASVLINGYDNYSWQIACEDIQLLNGLIERGGLLGAHTEASTAGSLEHYWQGIFE